jgi:Family of unknown function (DUF6152)
MNDDGEGRMFSKFLGLLAVLVLVFAVPARAHHSVQAEFDFDKPLELKNAVLTKIEWVNPHSYMFFEVHDASGKTVESWAFETHGVGGLHKLGLNADVVKVGQTYTVRGLRAKDGKNNAFLQEIQLPDGKVYRVWFGDPNGN